MDYVRGQVSGSVGTRLGRFAGSLMDRRSARSARWLAALALAHAALGLAKAFWLAVLLRCLASFFAAVSGLEDSEAACGSRAEAVASAVGCAIGSAGPLIWAATLRVSARRNYSAVLTTKRRGAGSLFAAAAVAAAAAAIWVRRRRRKRREPSAAAARVEPAAPVSSEPPALYVDKCGAQARQRWERTLEWRREHDADATLREPQPCYHAIKNRLYPHHLHGKTKRGEVIMWELLGKLDTSVLRNGEVHLDAAFRHFVFVHEFVSRMYAGEETRLVTVLDVAGLRFSQVNSSLMRLISTASRVVDNLVPFRATKILVIHAPSWFGAVFGGVRRVLPAEIRDKVEVLGPDFVQRLATEFEELPAEYGGATPLGQHDDELAMLRAACALNGGGDILSEGFFGNKDERPPPPVAAPAAAEEAPAPTPRPLFHLLRRDLPPRAHLGDAAQSRGFHYDANRGVWVFDRDDDNDDDEEEDEDDDDDQEAPRASRRRQRTEAQDSDSEDERALVAAIEAATLRRSLASDPQALRAFVHSRTATSECSALQVALVAGLGLSRFSRAFLAVAFFPWFLAPASRGGLGLRAGDAAVCCTAACLALAALAARCSEPLRRMPRDAPLRAFRVAAGGTFLVAAAAPELAPSLGGGVGTTGELPRDSTAVFLTAAAAAFLLLSFAHLLTAAAHAAVKLADRSPSMTVRSARLAGDLAGPPCAAALLHAALESNRAHFPVNASAGLSAVALLNAALYLGSFLVYKTVVGDVSGARATCAAFFELPARDLQRCAFVVPTIRLFPRC